MAETPLVVLVAGPNGAGKSTVAPRLLEGALHVEEFVNADVIASELSGPDPAAAAMAAGRIMLGRLRMLARERKRFAFETTLASRLFAGWLDGLRVIGYRSHITFLALPSPELAIARVAARVQQGGHHVPADTVRRRFRAGLRNLIDLYWQRVDSLQVFDNSRPGAPRLLVERTVPGILRVHDHAGWDTLLEWVR